MPLATLRATLETIGDLPDSARHCELVASAPMGGRIRSFHLSSGAWVTDVGGEMPLSTVALREGAAGPINFLCATIDAGMRLGGDRDEDTFLNGDDCDPADPDSWTAPLEVAGLAVGDGTPTQLTWDEQSGPTGPSVRYDVVSGTLIALRATGLASATSCRAPDLDQGDYNDLRADPPPGDGYYYLVRARNGGAAATFGPGRSSLDSIVCP